MSALTRAHTAPELALRRYEQADATRVWHLHVDGLEQARARAGDGRWDDDLHSIQETYLAANGEFLARCRAGLWPWERSATSPIRSVRLRRMRVDARYQRWGFGRMLLQALQARAIELGYHTLRLDTTPSMTAALALYASSGYRVLSRDSYPSGIARIVLQKDLLGGTGASPDTASERS